jgi:Holliday junction resolvase RusA-like endonuclease
MDGPLSLDVVFRAPMPASRSKAIRAAGRWWKPTAPDLDKLVRSVGDSLTASGLIKDDARIVALRAMKIEVDGWTGATISVHEIGNEPADEVIW